MKKDTDSIFESREVVDSNRIIYTPSDFARTSLFHLQEAGKLKAKREHVSRRNGLASYLFFIVDEGGGKVEYDGAEYVLEKDSAVFIDCKQAYSHATDPSLWRLRWVHFYGPNMSAIYGKYISRGGKNVFYPKAPEEYRRIIDEVYNIAKSDGYVRDMEIHRSLSELLVLLMKESVWDAGRASEGKASRLQDVKEYLNRNYTEKITLDALAERFYISKFYLLETFKREYGMGINQYIILLRINKSKELLRFTDMTAEKIAYECGMNSPHYFNRLFKKIEGSTPIDYRKRWINNAIKCNKSER